MEEWENRWQMAFHPEKCVIPRLVLLALDMLLLWLKICNLSYYVLGNPVFYWPWQ
jgi:hypothetical protein